MRRCFCSSGTFVARRFLSQGRPYHALPSGSYKVTLSSPSTVHIPALLQRYLPVAVKLTWPKAQKQCSTLQWRFPIPGLRLVTLLSAFVLAFLFFWKLLKPTPVPIPGRQHLHSKRSHYRDRGRYSTVKKVLSASFTQSPLLTPHLGQVY